MYKFFSTQQRGIAILLGVSQSHVARYYRSERKLPNAARVMLKSLMDATEEKHKQSLITSRELPQLNIKALYELKENFEIWIKLVRLWSDM